MLSLLIGSIVAAIAVFLAEYLGRKNILGKESSRKIPHIATGLAIAFVALFIDMRIMVPLLVVDALAVLIVYRFNLLPFSRAVDRLTWGELFFPLGVIGAAFISSDKWIFIAAVLVLGLADAAAALVGKALGKHKYKIFNHTKSLEGSTAFFITALIILALITFIVPSGLATTWPVIISLALLATIVEAIAPWGMDNLLLPILVAAALKLL